MSDSGALEEGEASWVDEMADRHHAEAERAHARRSDPNTSHAAAASITKLTDRQRSVKSVIRQLGRPVTDVDLVREYMARCKGLGLPKQSESGIRSRRSELSAAGHLEQGDKQRLATGRMARTWQIKEEENDAETHPEPGSA